MIHNSAAKGQSGDVNAGIMGTTDGRDKKGERGEAYGGDSGIHGLVIFALGGVLGEK